MCSAIALTDCTVMRIDKKSMMNVIHRERAFSDMFVRYLLTRNIRYEEDLVDQLFNSSEKRLARVLLLLAHFGKDEKPEVAIPRISQETLAEVVGTTRGRVNFFMNRLRKLGFIDYHGGDELQVHSSLLNVVLSRLGAHCSRAETSHSRLRHFFDDFGACRFGRLLWFSPTPYTHDFTGPGGYWSHLDQANLLSCATVPTRWLPLSPHFRSSDLSQSI